MSAHSILFFVTGDSTVGTLVDSIAAAGYAVSNSPTAAEMVHRCREQPPDVAVLDATIQPETALAIVASIREEPTTAAITVILVTNDSFAPYLRRTIELGIDDRLSTPFDADLLLAVIAARLRRSQALRGLHTTDDATQPGTIAPGQVSDTSGLDSALCETTAVLQSILENADEAICLLDPSGRERWCNPSFARLLPQSGYETEPRTFAERIHPSDQPALAVAIDRAHSTGRSGTFEYRAGDRDGNIRHFEANLCLVRDGGGNAQRLIVIARDVTDRRRAEHERTMTRILLDEAQRLESIGRLAAGIAHEINTPTQFVGDNLRFLKSSFADLLGLIDRFTAFISDAAKAPPAPDQVAELMQAIDVADIPYVREEIPASLDQSIEGMQRVARIVHAMREFSHPGSPEKVPADLNRAIENTSVVARNEWKYVADLVLDLDPDLGEVPCIVGELNQVVLNLIVNAAHAIGERVGETATGKGTITVSTRRVGDHAEIRIRDTGKGIPPEVQKHIFEPFFTTKPVGKGTGQGLAIAHSVVVDRHGGEITYETTMGEGTCFIVRIPTAPAVCASAA